MALSVPIQEIRDLREHASTCQTCKNGAPLTVVERDDPSAALAARCPGYGALYARFNGALYTLRQEVKSLEEAERIGRWPE